MSIPLGVSPFHIATLSTSKLCRFHNSTPRPIAISSPSLQPSSLSLPSSPLSCRFVPILAETQPRPPQIAPNHRLPSHRKCNSIEQEIQIRALMTHLYARPREEWVQAEIEYQKMADPVTDKGRLKKVPMRSSSMRLKKSDSVGRVRKKRNSSQSNDMGSRNVSLQEGGDDVVLDLGSNMTDADRVAGDNFTFDNANEKMELANLDTRKADSKNTHGECSSGDPKSCATKQVIPAELKNDPTRASKSVADFVPSFLGRSLSRTASVWRRLQVAISSRNTEEMESETVRSNAKDSSSSTATKPFSTLPRALRRSPKRSSSVPLNTDGAPLMIPKVTSLQRSQSISALSTVRKSKVVELLPHMMLSPIAETKTNLARETLPPCPLVDEKDLPTLPVLELEPFPDLDFTSLLSNYETTYLPLPSTQSRTHRRHTTKEVLPNCRRTEVLSSPAATNNYDKKFKIIR